MERPGYRDITVFALYPLSLRAYAGKILKNEHSAFGIRLSECLADAVIDVTHPTVLSLTECPHAASGARGLPMLELLAKLLIVSALSLCLTPVIESHFTCRIKADSMEVDS